MEFPLRLTQESTIRDNLRPGYVVEITKRLVKDAYLTYHDYDGVTPAWGEWKYAIIEDVITKVEVIDEKNSNRIYKSKFPSERIVE